MIRPLLATSSLLLLPSCSLLITPPEPQPHRPLALRQSGKSVSTPLLVFSHGYHTGLSLPSSALRPYLPELCEGLTDEWLEFGWGDEGFYRSEEITAKLVFSALCYPTPGVVHVVTIDQPLHRQYDYSPIRLLRMDEEETAKVGQFIAETFRRNEHGHLIDLGPGRYGRSNFYRAVQSYYFPRSCNAWTAKGLRQAGHPVHAVTAPGVMRQLPERSRDIPVPGTNRPH